MDIDPWDKGFETKADYAARKNKAEAMASPVKKEKEEKLAALKNEIKTARKSQAVPLEKQMQILLDKRFAVPASKVSFKFLTYGLVSQEMKGELKIDEKTSWFNVAILKKKAREYKKQPDLLIPDLKMKATLGGPKIDKIIFHGPNQDKKYIARACNSIGMEFEYIKSGTFMMGSPSSESGRQNDEKQHKVTLTKGFYMQTTEVTQGQWKVVMGNNLSYHKKGDDYPVENVSWYDVQEFIKKLNSMKEGGKYRLPTEAEWEYACRAGSTTRFCFGNDAGSLGKYAWYDNNSGRKTHPVAHKKPNVWGLYDMLGNVYEWCQDSYGDYPSGSVSDPEVHSSVYFNPMGRGGSYFYGNSYCRSANRCSNYPSYRCYHLGFRLAKIL